jgi:hypothetical protein
MAARANDQPFASLPNLKGSFDRTKIPRLAILGVVFDGGPCPCKSAAPSRAYSIFGENFCKRVGEFAIEHRNVGTCAHGHLVLC